MTRKMPEQPRPSPEIIAVFGQRAGVGATTTAVNLSLALAAAGRSVLLMDLDPEGQAGLAMGYEGQERGGTERALIEATFTREMITATKITEIYLAPAGSGLEHLENELALMEDSHTRLYQALATLPALSLEFDHVVLDCPPALDLLTRNALVAAHRVLLPLTDDGAILEGLPTLIKTVSRLRASLPQPLYGFYLLIGMRAATPSSQDLTAQMRQDYGRMSLLTEIPFDTRLKKADTPNQPLLMQGPTREIGRAYLSLAAEWLTLGELGDQRDGTWRFKAREERMARYRDKMTKGIEGWRIDPLSRLYDAEEAMRQQDAQALAELYQAAQPPRRFAWLLAWRPSRTTLLTLALAVVAVPAFLWLRAWALDAERRLELGAWLIGPQQHWEAGSLLLSRADETAYRELILAARLVERNREKLMACGEQARAGAPAPCLIDLPPRDAQP
ncbi:AAA family ATPase [Thiocystis violacea]|uniref:AAA family ATPase n=1 Tax=Thiocystis violacea TaxID=13725 RepID=UPI0019078837|nr:AAA family ATPase [Thiocystis violacea]MBK1717827.1 ATPase [Thiocystis violacea]